MQLLQVLKSVELWHIAYLLDHYLDLDQFAEPVKKRTDKCYE